MIASLGFSIADTSGFAASVTSCSLVPFDSGDSGVLENQLPSSPYS